MSEQFIIVDKNIEVIVAGLFEPTLKMEGATIWDLRGYSLGDFILVERNLSFWEKILIIWSKGRRRINE